ncbi:hypothetical protein JOB18_043739 [Solea senegalensis]|uniref:C-type lectin domain-containing protein n=1 Tax=Solea senegalensis TaxID=28829 RepID=A0AAV6RZ86_SOLSE|nr:hypothetical protein JOB18_016903 [Solea senegalensis]KAG7509432.1 hypothetical protein JOB18_043739 [Solea senegalensis]
MNQLNLNLTQQNKQCQESVNETNRLNSNLKETNGKLRSILRSLKSNKINCDMTTLTCSRCMEGWTEHDSRCFFLSGDAKKWLDARSYCIDKGGDLAVVLSEEDQKFLTKLIVKNYKSKEKFNGSWIGLHDMQRERTFRWINGKNLAKYINETGQETDYWVNGQPDNNTPGWSPEGSDCVVLVFELDESTDRAIKNWDDIACRGQRNYMCESKAFIME